MLSPSLVFGRGGFAKTTVESLLLSFSFRSFSMALAVGVLSLFGDVARGVSPSISETDFFCKTPDWILVALRAGSTTGVDTGVCLGGV